MTCIAFRGGILAADSMISYGSYHNGQAHKIHVVTMGGDLHRKVMIATSGIVWITEALVSWIEAGCPNDDIPHSLVARDAEFCCLMVNNEGRLFELNSGYWLECHVEYHAIGSGAAFALGAMAAGVSAPEAVHAASCHDKATGGPIHTMTVSDLLTKETP